MIEYLTQPVTLPLLLIAYLFAAGVFLPVIIGLNLIRTAPTKQPETKKAGQ